MNCVQKTKYHSFKCGKLTKGCEQCVLGRKLVIFITGRCAQRCWYCPVSEHKFGTDDAYANEWKIENPNEPYELIREAELTGAKGAGITGGDPLANVDRCVQYIKVLKERFGKNFHIHLYTPLQLVTKERLDKLYNAGLDEIRLHPNLDDKTLWPKLELAGKYPWKKGIEIPAIPGYEQKTKELVDFAAGKIDFLNLNELERSDTKASHYKLDEMGFKQKNEISYGIKDSVKMALDVIKYAKQKGMPTHICTSKLKDAVQLTKRIQHRAKGASLPYDIITEEGLLIRGCAYLPEIKPGLDYKKNLANANDETIKQLGEYEKKIRALGTTNTYIDNKKCRIILPAEFARAHSKELKKMGLAPFIIEEYPTADAIETTVDPL